MPQEAVPLLKKWLMRSLDAERFAWFNAQSAAVAQDPSEAALDIALGMVPRRLGKGSLDLTESDLQDADAALQGWSPTAWSVSDAARILLLCELPPGKKSFAERFRALCQTADAVELVTLYRGLPLYPAPEALQAIAPPMVDSSSLVGSGANKRPAAAAVLFISPTKAPGSTLIVRAFSSGAEIRSSERSESNIPVSVIEAPVVLV